MVAGIESCKDGTNRNGTAGLIPSHGVELERECEEILDGFPKDNLTAKRIGAWEIHDGMPLRQGLLCCMKPPMMHQLDVTLLVSFTSQHRERSQCDYSRHA